MHECLYTWCNSIETFTFSIVFNITIEEYFSIVRSFLLAIETMFIAFLCVHYCVGIVCIVYCCIVYTIVYKYLQFNGSIDILYCIFNVIIEGCSLSVP